MLKVVSMGYFCLEFKRGTKKQESKKKYFNNENDIYFENDYEVIDKFDPATQYNTFQRSHTQ